MTSEELLGIVSQTYRQWYSNNVPSDFVFTEETTFEELNLDSLEVVELSILLEDRLDFQFPSEVVDEARTVGDFISGIKKYKHWS